VAVLGAAVARQLYPVGSPVGERIRLGEDWVEVVGVLASRGGGKGRASAIRSRDVNRLVLVPLETLDHGSDPRPDGIDEIALRIADAQNVTAAAQVARSVLARTTNGAPLEIVVPREILKQRQRTQRVFDVVTGAIAAISLIVGGIGIMNIMLASVAERTREIGVRRALGARRRDIVLQFLVEASLLTTSGGLLGALVGLLGASAIQWFAGWPTAVAPSMLATSLVMALGVGVGFGLYPAWHAAELEPMEALRRD
jgi:putative ABC transport system permease protein